MRVKGDKKNSRLHESRLKSESERAEEAAGRSGTSEYRERL